MDSQKSNRFTDLNRPSQRITFIVHLCLQWSEKVSGVQGEGKSLNETGSTSQEGDRFFPLEEDGGPGLHRNPYFSLAAAVATVQQQISAQASLLAWQPNFMNSDCNLIITFFNFFLNYQDYMESSRISHQL